ncbi:hypothetical protein ACIBSW_26975 [Actinoplanes sp. NPDC049668]|uniref:hypothetical protein n=1 Tax=unclassified Actinoplanes TaxID=2626549 RepID=UPI00339FC2A4
MRSEIAQGEDGAPGVARRIVRLLVLLGVVVAVYLVLSLFDRAARADVGSIDEIGATDPVASVTAAGAKKAISTPKSPAPKVHPQRIHRPVTKMPKVHPPKIQTAEKISAPKIQKPKGIQNQVSRKIPASGSRDGGLVRRVQARTSELRQRTSDAVRGAARATMPPAGMAVVRQKLSTPVEPIAVPRFADLAQAALASWTQLPDQLPALPQQPRLPQAHFPALPQQPRLPEARTTASPIAPVPHLPAACPIPQSSASTPAPGLSGVTKPPAAQPQSRTAPLPAPARQPADHSTPTGQARDSGGGNAPAIGTVSSAWRPEVAAAERRLPTDLIARGRTVRYAGPPS